MFLQQICSEIRKKSLIAFVYRLQVRLCFAKGETNEHH